MKKTLILLALVLGITPAFSEAKSSSDSEAPKVIVKMVEAHMNLAPFTAVSSDIVGNIVYVPSDRYRIEAEGPERIINNIDARVKDGVLRITTKKSTKVKMVRGEKLTLTIYGQSLQKVRLDGVGNFKCPETIDTQKMEIVNTGVGSIRMDNLLCDELIVKNEGVGNITLKGKTEKASILSDGVGSIYAYDMQSLHTTVNLNGVGSVQCHAAENCELTSNGVGHIYYKGNPAVERIHKNGVGAISKR